MNKVKKYGLLILVISLLLAVDILYVIMRTNAIFFGVFLLFPLGFGLQFCLYKFIPELINNCCSEQADAKCQKEIEALDKKYICEDRKIED